MDDYPPHVYETVKEITDDTMRQKEMDPMAKFLQCSICTDIFDNPKDLSCRHSFCKCCLDKRLSFGNDGRVVICCPKDDCNVQTPLSNEETTHDLTTSIQFKYMADELKRSTATLDVCQRKYVCKGEDDCNEDITVYCKVCSLFLCHQCHGKHKNKHEETFFTSIRVDRKDNMVKGWCEKHAVYAEFICKHDCCDKKLICMYCKHRQHKDHCIEHIQTITDDIKSRIEKSNAEHKNIDNMRDKFALLLGQRKKKCLEMYHNHLCNEEERLLEEFENLAKRNNYNVEVYNKENIPIFLEMERITMSIEQKSSFDLHLSDMHYDDPHPLGELPAVDDMVYSYASSGEIIPSNTVDDILLTFPSVRSTRNPPTALSTPSGSGDRTSIRSGITSSRPQSSLATSSEGVVLSTRNPPTALSTPSGSGAGTSVHSAITSSHQRNSLATSSESGDLSPEEISAALVKLNAKKFVYLSSLIEENKVNILKAILPQFANIIHLKNSRNQESAAHVAAACDRLEALQLLINNGAELNIIDKAGNSILHHAAANDSSTVMTWVLSINKTFINSPNRSGETPLYTAARKGSERCLKLLLENGGDRNFKCSLGMSPLEAAKIKCQKAMFSPVKRAQFQKIISMINNK